ncbi:MAG: hypothetical protein K6G52_06340 [Treponemataceae bacterium]|nr:hypothetical protein [Treponemataceae bacterium]
MKLNSAVKIVCELNTSLEPQMSKILQDLGIQNFHAQKARTEVYRERKAYFGLTTKLMIEDDPNTIYSFYIPKELEEKVLREIAHRLNLNIAGYGSIWSEKVEISGSEKFINSNIDLDQLTAPESLIVSKNLVAMDIIVQRGLSEDIIKAALDLGMCVPCIFYGIGTGFRNTIGILRITIPAEKEIIRIIVPKSESEEVMNKLIDVGHLDKPGKGFIYLYSANMGIIDTKIFRGKSLSAASMEQIIAAIDGLKGNVDWRKKETSHLTGTNSKRKFLTDMSNMSIFNDEGFYEQLVTKAMENGAAGATTSNERFKGGSEDAKDISPSRERSDFVISNEQKEKLVDVISEEEVFQKNENGFIELKKVMKACTYLG